MKKFPPHFYRSKAAHGFTMVELLVSMGIMSLIFSFLGFLTLISARNSHNLHQQLISQEAAAKANQRLTFQMRNAYCFKKFDTDTGGGPFTRLKLGFPSSPTAYTTHTIALHVRRDPAHPTDNSKTKQEIRYYNRELSSSDFTDETVRFYEGRTLQTVTIPSVTADNPQYRFPLITNFKLFYRNDFRVVLETSYRYNGFAFRFSNPEFQPEGRFTTECIAKNHFMNEGVDSYGDAYNETSGPATLF
jgi:prepilin-type N-terminal cleavage/methylation domain-containing protein